MSEKSLYGRYLYVKTNPLDESTLLLVETIVPPFTLPLYVGVCLYTLRPFYVFFANDIVLATPPIVKRGECNYSRFCIVSKCQFYRRDDNPEVEGLRNTLEKLLADIDFITPFMKIGVFYEKKEVAE